MRILQVNYYDNLGGAARIAWLLHNSFLNLNHESWIVAGIKTSNDPFTYQIPVYPPRPVVGRPFFYLANFIEKYQWKIRGRNLSGIFRRLADPQRYWGRYQGKEDFNFPGSHEIINLISEKPDIVHLHNLHLNYFDLTMLPNLSSQFPTVLTLHDMWPLTGHCAHSMECDRWETGCGVCPNLNTYPAMHHDQTAYNWQRKKEIFSQSRLYITGPSKWIVQIGLKSILSPAIIKTKVIPNGIDLSIFHPGNKSSSRKKLDLPLDASILLFVSTDGMRINSYKDYQTLEIATDIVSTKFPHRKLLFIAIGAKNSIQKYRNVEIRKLSHIGSPELLAHYYRAADIYLHATKAESFGLVVAEAQACGTPVIASRIGGIPEIIQDGQSGLLVSSNNPQEMADKIITLLNNPTMIESMGIVGANYARDHFGVEKMVSEYLDFYEDIVDEWKSTDDIFTSISNK